MANSDNTSEPQHPRPSAIREYIVRLHDPVDASVPTIQGKGRMKMRVHFARSSTPPIVPHVGDEVDIGTASYAEAAKARFAAHRTRIVTHVAHYLEIDGDGYVDHVDVYTDWRRIGV